MKHLNLITLALALGVFTSCSKPADNAAPATASSNNTNTTSNAKQYGVLSCRITKLDSGTSPTYSGSLIAFFKKNPDSTTSVSAGTVKADSYTLTMDPFYFLYSKTVTPTWTTVGPSYTVSGSSDIPAFNYATTKGFPAYPVLTSSTTLTRASGYTLAFNAVACDSITLTINDGGFTYVTKHLPGSATSHTFSAADLNVLNLANNAGYISIEAINFEYYTTGNKKYMFGQSRIEQKFKLTIN